MVWVLVGRGPGAASGSPPGRPGCCDSARAGARGEGPRGARHGSRACGIGGSALSKRWVREPEPHDGPDEKGCPTMLYHTTTRGQHAHPCPFLPMRPPLPLLPRLSYKVFNRPIIIARRAHRAHREGNIDNLRNGFIFDIESILHPNYYFEFFWNTHHPEVYKLHKCK